MGEHRRRLAEAHVERQATTEAGSLEEADPGNCLGLVRAQRALEALGLGDRRRRHLTGAADDVVGPAVAVHHDPAGEPGSAETDALPKDLGAGQLVDALT